MFCLCGVTVVNCFDCGRPHLAAAERRAELAEQRMAKGLRTGAWTRTLCEVPRKLWVCMYSFVIMKVVLNKFGFHKWHGTDISTVSLGVCIGLGASARMNAQRCPNHCFLEQVNQFPPNVQNLVGANTVNREVMLNLFLYKNT